MSTTLPQITIPLTPVHVFLTTPHEKCDPSVTIRHCDRLSGAVANRIVDHIKRIAGTSRNLKCTYVRGTICRALLDLNRPIARMSTWRRQLDTLINQAVSEGEHVILLDVHSYNSDQDMESPYLPTRASLYTAYMLVPATTPVCDDRSTTHNNTIIPHDDCNKNYDNHINPLMRDLYTYLQNRLGNDYIGLEPCAEMNDIVNTVGNIPGVVATAMICVNESLSHDEVNSLSQTFTSWLEQLCKAN